MKKNLMIVVGLSFSVVNGFAADLQAIYQQAAANNATYLAAQNTYKAASFGIPIARANLLPTAIVTANTTANHQSPGESGYFNTNGYMLTLSQPLLALGAWYGYSQAEATYRQAAVTYAEALQTVIMTTATAYFGVLEAQDQLKYAVANQASLKEQLKQTQIQYKVGLQAYTDVQSAEASYQSAVASTIAAQNSLNNAQENLVAVTGQPAPPLAPLKQDFPLLKPNPQNAAAWVNYSLQNNLALQAAELETEINRLGIKVDAMNGYAPTINAVGSYANNSNGNNGNSNNSGSAGSSISNSNNYNGQRISTTSGGLQLNWNAFSGGATYATVKQDEFTYQAAQANEAQTRLETQTNVTQAYLNVLSDISQVQAYQQAVVSGQASLKAMKAGYTVGTQTIVDVLTQQSNLFSSEQSYAEAIYNYINDSLTLKQQAGVLAPDDIAAVNTWLDASATPAVATDAALNAAQLDQAHS